MPIVSELPDLVLGGNGHRVARGVDRDSHGTIEIVQRDGQFSPLGAKDGHLACLIRRNQQRSVQAFQNLGQILGMFETDFPLPDDLARLLSGVFGMFAVSRQGCLCNRRHLGPQKSTRTDAKISGRCPVGGSHRKFLGSVPPAEATAPGCRRFRAAPGRSPWPAQQATPAHTLFGTSGVGRCHTSVDEFEKNPFPLLTGSVTFAGCSRP